ISYNNTRDGERAAWIARTLIDNGYTVHFQATDCKPGMDFLTWMEDAILHSGGFWRCGPEPMSSPTTVRWSFTPPWYEGTGRSTFSCLCGWRTRLWGTL
ncbi:MAG: toll/interleukin-1 receptor domain-containing protein, partial [Oscillibacter sp.]|nr:toll/interleukin-1 receptor domain-containing protein [Oscillibacter sp.]